MRGSVASHCHHPGLPDYPGTGPLSLLPLYNLSLVLPGRQSGAGRVRLARQWVEVLIMARLSRTS